MSDGKITPQQYARQQRLVHDLFERYEREFNQGLQGQADLDAIAGLYANAFIAATPAGVFGGDNDDKLKDATTQGFQRYRDTGCRRMDLRGLETKPFDALHALARVDWSALYEVNGERKAIPFTNLYLVRVEGDDAKVFGWITGDEAALLKQHGIG